ncbi:MAG TPA: efflux RND transporter periplasmic adaptor subunit [Candidatus Baltobacteraceae bacterium]|nr:efflux RND transporter periplasmic adaptor subunit [Candidatus Baltobacteraceae bacterium]
MPVQTEVKSNGVTSVPAAPPKRKQSRRWMLVALLVLVLLAAAIAVLLASRARSAPSYETTAVVRGRLTQSVTASGTINPEDTISVGTQVSGTIETLYVDYNSPVHQGQVLAQIEPSQFVAQLSQARAAFAQAQAQAVSGTQTASGAAYGAQASNQAAVSARADLVRAQAAADLARVTLARDRALLRNGYIARSQYDSDYSADVAAAAALRSARSSIEQTAAQAQQASAGAGGSRSSAVAAAAAADAARAIVQQDALNLQHTTIVSPVDGTVVARNVSVGQTVAASFQTPTLFTIARDLRKMEADIAVGEPDIGNVRPGQAADFTVLAYPNRTFHGTVSQVRENPTTIANVVTYTVVILVGNKDNALLPGMTANAAISVASISNALLVPIQALQYRPASAPRSTSRPAGAASPWGQTGADVSGAVVAGSHRRLFVLRDGKAAPVRVIVQLVNGTTAAVTPLGALKAGEPVIVGDANTASRAQNASNPAFGVGRVVR